MARFVILLICLALVLILGKAKDFLTEYMADPVREGWFTSYVAIVINGFFGLLYVVSLSVMIAIMLDFSVYFSCSDETRTACNLIRVSDLTNIRYKILIR